MKFQPEKENLTGCCIFCCSVFLWLSEFHLQLAVTASERNTFVVDATTSTGPRPQCPKQQRSRGSNRASMTTRTSGDSCVIIDYWLKHPPGKPRHMLLQSPGMIDLSEDEPLYTKWTVSTRRRGAQPSLTVRVDRGDGHLMLQVDGIELQVPPLTWTGNSVGILQETGCEDSSPSTAELGTSQKGEVNEVQFLIRLDSCWFSPHTHTDTHTHARMHTSMHTRAQACKNARIHACKNAHTNTQTHARVHAHARTQPRMHARTYAQLQRSARLLIALIKCCKPPTVSQLLLIIGFFLVSDQVCDEDKDKPEADYMNNVNFASDTAGGEPPTNSSISDTLLHFYLELDRSISSMMLEHHLVVFLKTYEPFAKRLHEIISMVNNYSDFNKILDELEQRKQLDVFLERLTELVEGICSHHIPSFPLCWRSTLERFLRDPLHMERFFTQLLAVHFVLVWDTTRHSKSFLQPLFASRWTFQLVETMRPCTNGRTVGWLSLELSTQFQFNASRQFVRALQEGPNHGLNVSQF